MKLFLASRIKDPSTLEELKKYSGGFQGKKIALIPTASNGENKYGSYKEKNDGTWHTVHSLDCEVVDILLEDYRDFSVVGVLKKFDIIWVMGGMPGYLAYWMRRCSLDKHLQDILSKDIIYVGSSAGAMVTGQTLQVSAWNSVDNERGAEGIKPLGLVDFDIFPHYKEEYLEEIKKRYTGKKLYLLKDGEEIIVENDNFKLIGEERIITNG